MPPTLSGQFVSVFVANAAGVLTDISPYLTAIVPQRASQQTDLTTFASGGGPVTRNIIRGAAISEWTLDGLYDPVLAKLYRQIIAARSGVLIQAKAGSNAIPVQGDTIIQGTYIMLSCMTVYNANSPASLNADIKPADGGSIVPFFGNI